MEEKTPLTETVSSSACTTAQDFFLSSKLSKHTLLFLFLCSPLLGWLYFLLTLVGLALMRKRFAKYGFGATLFSIHEDTIAAVASFTVYFMIAPFPVMFLFFGWEETGHGGTMQLYHKYGPAGSLLVVSIYLGVLIHRFQHSTETKEPPQKRLEKYLITPITAKGVTYQNAADLYGRFLVPGPRHRWTLFLAMIVTIGQAVLVKSMDKDTYSFLWWSSLFYWTGIFFVFDTVCIAVIMRYDTLRVMLNRFNRLTDKNDLRAPYLDLNERVIDNTETFDVTTTTNFDIRNSDSQPGKNSKDNFEAWIQIRESLVSEITTPDATTAAVFVPTCGIVLFGLAGSILYVIIRVVLQNYHIQGIATSMIFVLFTTTLATASIFTIAGRIGGLFAKHHESIAKLEFDVAEAIAVREKQWLDDARTMHQLQSSGGSGTYSPTNASVTSSTTIPHSPLFSTTLQMAKPPQIQTLRHFQRLVIAARMYIWARSGRPRILGFRMQQWVWIGLFSLGISLNGLFVVASVNDPITKLTNSSSLC
eukprot:PhF_6_TR33639/c0_g1_i1/m.49174